MRRYISMFFERMKKKKQGWYIFSKNPPQYNEQVLFCDYNDTWIGKVIEVSKDVSMVFVKDENQGWIYSFVHSRPVFWRYLQIRPEKPDCEEALSRKKESDTRKVEFEQWQIENRRMRKESEERLGWSHALNAGQRQKR